MDFEARKNDGIAELTSEPHLTEKNLASNRSKAKNNVERLKQLQDRLQMILRNNLRDEIDEIGGASILQSEMVSALETHNSAINKRLTYFNTIVIITGRWLNHCILFFFFLDYMSL